MIDFPDTPTPGQEFTVGALTWFFDDPVWRLKSSGGGGSDGYSFIQDTPPTATASGQTWFNTSNGNSYVWFEDVDGGQWVQDGPGSGGGGGGGGSTPAAPRLVTMTKLTGGDTDGMGDQWVRLNNLEATFDAKAGRTYRIMARCRFEMEPSASNGLGNLALTRGPTYDSANGLAFIRVPLGPITPGNIRILTIEDYWTPTSDSPGQRITVHAALDNSPAGIFSHRPRPNSAESILVIEDVT